MHFKIISNLILKVITLFGLLDFCFPKEYCGNKYCFFDSNRISLNYSCPEGTWPLEFPKKEIYESFINLVPITGDIKINGVLSEDKNWTWTTGRKLNSEIIIENNDGDVNFLCIKNGKYQVPKTRYSYFFCQSCNDVKNKLCFEIKTSRIPWSEAMNYCLERNKRLAVFEDDQVPKQLSDRLDSSKCYWIGLARSYPKWPHYNQMVTFSRWINFMIPQYPQGNCIFIRDLSFWDFYDCKIPMRTICMNETIKISKTTSYS